MKKISYAKMFIVLLLLLLIFSCLIVFFKIKYLKKITNEVTENIKNGLENSQDTEKKAIFQNESIGLIIIPKLNMEAPIYEGTDKETLKYYVRTF